MRFVAQRSHYERLVSLKKRDIKLYVMCHTAKAYFPDRQSCSTLCRQPSGCARSVEVVAVYPSLGSYSIVGLLRWASPPFKNVLHPIRKKVGANISLFQKKFLKNLFFKRTIRFLLIIQFCFCPPYIREWESSFCNRF